QHHKASEYSDRALDQFEQIYADAASSARVMALVVHPYIMGAPHRLKYFRRVLETISQKSDVKFWTGAQIADCYRDVGPKAPGRPNGRCPPRRPSEPEAALAAILRPG